MSRESRNEPCDSGDQVGDAHSGERRAGQEGASQGSGNQELGEVNGRARQEDRRQDGSVEDFQPCVGFGDGDGDGR